MSFLIRFTLIISAVWLIALPSRADNEKRDSPEAAAGNRQAPEETVKDRPRAEAERGQRDNPEAKRDGPRDAPARPLNRDEQKAVKVFRAYDKDESGSVDPDEIAGMREGKLSSRQKREIRDQVRDHDQDKSESLEQSEFLNWYLRRDPKRDRE